MQSLIPFNFDDALVRVIMRDGDPWFVLTDVCHVLAHSNASVAGGRLDDDEKAEVSIVYTSPNGVTQNRDVTIISESGLYSLVLTSRKEEAKRFKKWITAELLPQLRRTGRYELAPAMEADPLVAANFDPSALHAAIAAVREARRLRGVAAGLRMWRAFGLPAIDAGAVASGDADDLAEEIACFIGDATEITYAEIAAGMGIDPDDFQMRRRVTDRLHLLGWKRVVTRRGHATVRVWRRAAARQGETA